MNVFVLLNTKEDILKSLGNGAVLGTIDFHCILFVPTIEVNGAPKQPGYKLSSEYLRKNKHIHSGLERLEGEYMTEFSFLGELSL